MPAGPPPEKKFRPFLTLTLLIVFTVLVVWRMQTAPDYRDKARGFVFSGKTMGTTWHVKVVVQSLSNEERQAIERAVAAAVEAVDQAMSTYKPESELSRFNASGSLEPFPLSAPTIEVLMVARRAHDLSGGAFDPTVGPLVDAWGFGPAKVEGSPSADELSQLLEEVGFSRLQIDQLAGRVTKETPSLRIDLSGVAKGFAVDQVAAALLELGHSSFMVEIGGETKVQGTNERSIPFRIGVERPALGGERELLDVLNLTDLAVATSGDYRNYREVDGERVSHTIDPRTGRPIKHRLASVSVVHTSCAFADAMATALNVLGPEAGLALATREGLAAQFVVRTDEGEFTVEATAPFKELLATPGEE